MPKPTICCVVGTRPEAIKMAPVALELRRYSNVVESVLISTGQHREILTQALAAFGLEPDMDLEIMEPGQTLADITAKALAGLGAIFAHIEPEMVLAQGDTTTTFAAALASFYARIPFGHVEAGLRTPTVDDPFPEEFNRRAASLVSCLHFAPTRGAADNLIAEGYDAKSVTVTGNTGIDAVLAVPAEGAQVWAPDASQRVVTVTTHRRENWGEPQRRIARAVLRLVERFPDVRAIVPMHPNPDVRETLRKVLGAHDRIDLVEPPGYPDFVALMRRSDLILSDSGGVQEEAPALGVPVLVLRDTTERKEGIDQGTAKLVGTEEDRIFTEGERLLGDDNQWSAMAHAASPYGDGKASARVRYRALKLIGVDSPEAGEWI